jgi:hypothetical protein
MCVCESVHMRGCMCAPFKTPDHYSAAPNRLTRTKRVSSALRPACSTRSLHMVCYKQNFLLLVTPKLFLCFVACYTKTVYLFHLGGGAFHPIVGTTCLVYSPILTLLFCTLEPFLCNMIILLITSKPFLSCTKVLARSTPKLAPLSPYTPLYSHCYSVS